MAQLSYYFQFKRTTWGEREGERERERVCIRRVCNTSLWTWELFIHGKAMVPYVQLSTYFRISFWYNENKICTGDWQPCSKVSTPKILKWNLKKLLLFYLWVLICVKVVKDVANSETECQSSWFSEHFNIVAGKVLRKQKG